MRLVADAFLSERLGRNAWTLRYDPENPAADAGRLAELLEGHPGFVQARVEPERMDVCAMLEACGFALADVNLTFQGRPSGGANAGSGQMQVGPARPEDRETLQRLAGQNLICNRFHLDPAIPKQVASDIKARWVGNYFDGKRGDALLTARDERGVLGFLLLLGGPAHWTVDLVAVDLQARRQGVGSVLLWSIPGLAAQDASVTVGTSAANMAAIRLYQSLGLRLERSTLIFHRHGAQEP
ncbi:MAG: GNAT family N-acetyltransferase [Desulfovibrionaceae bacterium]